MTEYRRVLVTGGGGFIGSCYVRDTLAQERLPIEGLAVEIEQRVKAPWQTPKLG